MSSATTGTGRPGLHPSQILSLIIGATYTLVGLAGFTVTGFDNFAGITNQTLLGFEINPLHNIVHLVIGVLGLAMSRTLGTARGYGWLLTIVYGATFLYGLAAVGNDDLNLLSLNAADNVLHAVSALAGLLIALWPARDPADSRQAATAR